MSKVIEALVGKNQDGHLDAFFLGEDGVVTQTWLNLGSSEWASPVRFATDIVKLVSAVPDDRGRLHLVCVNSKGEVLDSMQPTPNGGTYWTELKKIS